VIAELLVKLKVLVSCELSLKEDLKSLKEALVLEVCGPLRLVAGELVVNR
jgi:hypothetical protein